MAVKVTDDRREDVMEILPDGSLPVTTNPDQLDAFSNVRTAPPSFVADGQLTYDLQPLIYEPLTSANGTIAHDATNRCATISLASASSGEETYMQSFSHYRYQAGRGQEIFLTGAAHNLTANTEAFWRYGDGDNAIEYATNGTLLGSKFTVRSNTDSGDVPVTSANWNIDPLDGSGPSKRTLDPTKTQIAIFDVQALYVGRVRCGFDLDGEIIWAHEFYHANNIAVPYIQTANLPISAGIRATDDGASGDMRFVCSCVLSRGGQERIAGYDFAVNGSVTAASGARTHLLSIRPKTTFNSITNRVEFVLEDIEVLVTGNSPVYWELVLGQALTTPTYADANATYSAFEYATAETLSGNPGVVFASGYCAASNQTKGVAARSLTNRYPLTLNAGGAVRDMGTLSLLVTGLGGTSATRAVIKWKELR
jgi:hypothetical protein